MKTLVALMLAVLFVPTLGRAAVKTELVQYKQGDTVCEGWLAYDPAVKGARPGVLLVHDWFGATDHQKEQVQKLAALGYVALAADVYGKGVRPTTASAAGVEAGKLYKDRALARARVRAGLDYLSSRPQTDATRLAVTGYCFGGMCALELARSGAPVKAVVTFHGSLASADPADAKNIKASVLNLHGADDPYVKAEEVRAYQDEMRAAGVDWQFVQYSGAVHSFTDERAGTDNSKGAAYNALADKRSWQAMKDFLAERLAK
jgi:dienelactone hydrolase